MNFKASFTFESDPVFKVNPAEGILPSLGFQGITFTLTYNPFQYGVTNKVFVVNQGKLVIETEDFYWSFTVTGSFTQYKMPEINSSLIDNHMELV